MAESGDGSAALVPERPLEPVEGAEWDGPLLEATDLVAGYVPEVNILNGCNLSLFPGELVGIIGPNGAGKSTFLKAVFGLIPIRSGTVKLRGDDITAMRAHDLVAKGVGYVPQTNNVFPRLTVEENLEMGMYQRPKLFGERMEFVCELFPLLGQRRKQRAGSLSGGERQMLAMAMALMVEPRVLLLDEPSAGLSPVAAERLFDAISEINRQGLSIVIVEQNASEALNLSNRAYILVDGKNSRTGDAKQLAGDPDIRRVFLGG